MEFQGRRRPTSLECPDFRIVLLFTSSTKQKWARNLQIEVTSHNDGYNHVQTSTSVYQGEFHDFVHSDVVWVRYSESQDYTVLVLTFCSLDTGTIGSVTDMPQFEATMGPISSTIRGVVVSSILPTGALAALVAGVLADRYGRKYLILSGAIIYGIGAAIECASVVLGMFIFGRLVKGVGQGLFLSTVYVQVSEISPARTRGTMTSIPQFLLVCGLVIGFFMSYGTASLPSTASWRLPIGVASFLAFAFAAMNVFTPPSPRWLLAKGQTDQARIVVAALGLDPAEQHEFLNSSASGLEHSPDESVWDGLKQTFREFGEAFDAPFRARTAFGCFIMACQQFVGIDGILYYAPILFRQAGLSGGNANFLASGVSSLVILATTIPATIWADKWGRRTSSVLGGTCITMLMLIMGTMYAADLVHSNHGAGRWVVIISIYLFAIVFNGTWALSFRTYLVESLPRKTRSSASSLGQCSNWVSITHTNFLGAF